MIRRVRRFTRSFGYAGAGIIFLLRTQFNFRVHLLATVVVGILCAVLGVRGVELAVVALTVGMVLVAEAVNTAIEATVDLVSPRFHPLAAAAKDTAAAATLLAAGTAVIVGAVILLPRLLARL